MKPTPEQIEQWADESGSLASNWHDLAAEDREKESGEFAEMYEEDAKDAERIEKLLRDGKWEKALDEVALLDTLPRESYEWARSVETLGLRKRRVNRLKRKVT